MELRQVICHKNLTIKSLKKENSEIYNALNCKLKVNFYENFCFNKIVSQSKW
jgi:hypothetical protein